MLSILVLFYLRIIGSYWRLLGLQPKSLNPVWLASLLFPRVHICSNTFDHIIVALQDLITKSIHRLFWVTFFFSFFHNILRDCCRTIPQMAEIALKLAKTKRAYLKRCKHDWSVLLLLKINISHWFTIVALIASLKSLT